MSFVPSTSFYPTASSTPPPATTPRRLKRLYIPPSNTLPPPQVDLPSTLPDPQSPLDPANHSPAEAALDPPENPTEGKLLAPVLQEELENDPLLRKTINGDFAKITAKSETSAKPKCPKSNGNFVRLNMKKGRSLANMGKVRNAGFAHRRIKFMPRNVSEEGVQLKCFSQGYGLERQKPQRSVEDILRIEFGFNGWLDQQKEAIEAVLAGQSTLVVRPTGSGKSLVYQLCARVLGGLTVAVFPLVSLIADQLAHIPACLAAGCLHSSQSSFETASVLRALRANALDILLLTPEKLCYFLALPLQDVRLVCVDEAHCVSEWSHAFRSAYYDVVSFGKRHNVDRWVALTATATQRTITDITVKFRIQKTIISDIRLRENMKITISRESDVLSAASDLIRSLPKDHNAIVFAAYQQQAQSLCDWLRAQGLAAKCYHGKMTEQEKAGVQAAFNSGQARILVTTLAFGMGIDKANLRAVVHLTLPKSIEQYIQESGRAGRDGSQGWSHVFIAKEQYYTFQGYIVSEHVTPRCVHQLIRSFLPPLEGEKRLPGLSGGTEPLELACIDTLELEELLGVNRQTIRLLLALLENQQLLTYGSMSYLQGCISFHKRPAAEVAAQYSAVSQALAVGRQYGGKWTFAVPLVAKRVGVMPSELVQVFRRLEVTGDVTVEFKKDCMCFRLHRGVDDDELPLLASQIASQCREIESCELHKLQCIYQMLYQNSSPTFPRADSVQSALSTYIQGYYEDESVDFWSAPPLPSHISDLCSDILGEFSYPPDEKDVACVLMGIRTAKVKREQWGQQAYWGQCAECDFFAVLDRADLFLRNQLAPETGRKRRKES